MIQRRLRLSRFWVWGLALMLSGAVLAQDAPTHRWSVSDPKPRLANRFTLSLAVCDSRRFAWAPVALPPHPGFISRFETEIAIEQHADGQPCVGTRWSWTLLPIRSGDLVLETVRLQASRFGQPIDYAITGPGITVSAPPDWLPAIVANRRPARFDWVPTEPQRPGSASETVGTKDFVQQTLRVQSSLSRDALEKWLAIMLEDQAAWRSLPPFIAPAPGGLGDDFLVTFFAQATPPEIPALHLQMTILDPETLALETRHLMRPAEAVPQVGSASGTRLLTLWSQVYDWGQRSLPWLSLLTLLFVFLFTQMQKEGWRLQRLWLDYRVKTIKTYPALWALLRKSRWPSASAPQTTPRAWAQGVCSGIENSVDRSALWSAVTALEEGLFSDRPTRDLRLVGKALVEVLQRWRPPLVDRDTSTRR